jgi:hypothetical protein
MASGVTNRYSANAAGIIRRGRRAGRSEIDIAGLVNVRAGVEHPRIHEDSALWCQPNV